MLARIAITTTMTVEIMVSRRLGQTTLAVSARTCWRNVRGLVLSAMKISQGFARRDAPALFGPVT